ncbi:glycosyltransferase family 4 protein [Dickeya chrysanthemi]|uniref:glycosyltransferase family 4 protein n=1 Tax=Dickeya chrysanthemi TaxID=556 RepID=UPI000532E1DC|nr:glycosyltransferase family 1 protein [Dickeya chrysanthemi]
MKVIFDCTSLANWIGHPTGIQRVVSEIGSELLHCFSSVYLGFFQADGSCFEYDLISRSVSDPIMPESGDVIITAGSNWDFIEHHKTLLRWRDKGIKLGVLFYDTIPCLLPFSYGPGFPEIYRDWLIESIASCDLAFAISENTKRDLNDFAIEHGLKLPSVTVVRLGDSVPSSEGTPSDEIVQKISEPYLLSVGSIEYRKNHIMLLNAWRYMIEEQGYIPPKLYIVGRKGWLDSDIEYQLDNDIRLKGRIEVLKGLQDADLRLLYEKTMFTLYPSFYEGWGLPVAESLCFGKPCIASRSSSMLEIAPGLVRHAHPLLLNEWVEQIRLLADNPAELQRECSKVKHNYHPSTWKNSAIQLRDGILAHYPWNHGD